jgi:hypothetical protein
MIEVGVVFDVHGGVLHWHLPPGRTSVSIPDTRDLWQVLWTNRAVLGGVAHSHPGTGTPTPSHIDLTTFAACEAGLGRRLEWYITTADQLACFAWAGPERLAYQRVVRDPAPGWLNDLRAHSIHAGRQP